VIPSSPELLAISRAACKIIDFVVKPFLVSADKAVDVDLVSSMGINIYLHCCKNNTIVRLYYSNILQAKTYVK
jgi:hypothetical protein